MGILLMGGEVVEALTSSEPKVSGWGPTDEPVLDRFAGLNKYRIGSILLAFIGLVLLAIFLGHSIWKNTNPPLPVHMDDGEKIALGFGTFGEALLIGGTTTLGYSLYKNKEANSLYVKNKGARDASDERLQNRPCQIYTFEILLVTVVASLALLMSFFFTGMILNPFYLGALAYAIGCLWACQRCLTLPSMERTMYEWFALIYLLVILLLLVVCGFMSKNFSDPGMNAWFCALLALGVIWLFAWFLKASDCARTCSGLEEEKDGLKACCFWTPIVIIFASALLYLVCYYVFLIWGLPKDLPMDLMLIKCSTLFLSVLLPPMMYLLSPERGPRVEDDGRSRNLTRSEGSESDSE